MDCFREDIKIDANIKWPRLGVKGQKSFVKGKILTVYGFLTAIKNCENYFKNSKRPPY
jgi:hypothetical protein